VDPGSRRFAAVRGDGKRVRRAPRHRDAI
jgi:hypothetical protein